MPEHSPFLKQVRHATRVAWAILIFAVGVTVCASNPALLISLSTLLAAQPAATNLPWAPPKVSTIPADETGKMILYGRELVSHTAVYLGPKGKVMTISNGMNCQNCHLQAGTLFFGNNYSAVASTYPKFRARSGSIESIERRVNECIERSLNGQKLPDESREMKAIVSYVKWVGKEVPTAQTPEGSGIWKLPYLNRPADSVRGKIVYRNTCLRCHNQQGEGMMSENGLEWKYPPLAGRNSFNIGAGLFRLSRFAGYVKANMPNDLATYDKPLLTDEESWDVAAYILSLSRPTKDISSDWTDLSMKPVDHPFGPFADGFSEQQHKYGPFTSMPDPANIKR